MSRPGEAGEHAPRIVEERAAGLFAAANSLLGDRLAECRLDPDRRARITVVDLNDDDVATLQSTASRLGISEWTRIERADPVELNTWEQVRRDLIKLRDQRPHVLQMYPILKPGYQRPPVRVDLAASKPGVAVAAELHDRYGEFLELHVGVLALPPDHDSARTLQARRSESHRALVDPAEMVVELDGALTISTGQTVTHGVLLLNTGERRITVNTNGKLTAIITDPRTGDAVGGFAGAQLQPLVWFTSDPGQTIRMPLLVGTASFDPELGYTIPAGAWHLTAPLDLADGRQLITPPLKVTVTD